MTKLKSVKKIVCVCSWWNLHYGKICASEWVVTSCLSCLFVVTFPSKVTNWFLVPIVIYAVIHHTAIWQERVWSQTL